LGVLRRNPDAKWKLQPEFLDKIRQTQTEILAEYSKIVKPGGKMVYATCSVLPSENEQQVAGFLQHHPNFKLIKEKKILPNLSGFDGFYMALMERKD
jgi:16S rRNA (cytosine967-C5)-methyltransferase